MAVDSEIQQRAEGKMHLAVQIPETAERLRVCIEITCGVAAGI